MALGVSVGSASRSGSVRHDRGDHVGHRPAGEERPAGQHLPQQHAERPHVRASVHRLAARLLRRHVGRRAEDDAGNRPGVRESRRLRHHRAEDRPSRDSLAQRLGEAEVEHLHLAAGRELDVRGLQVAMDDALVVGFLEGFGDLRGDLECLVEGNRAACEPLLEVFALHQFERDEELPGRFFQPVDGGDVRVVQRGEQLGLAPESSEALGVLGHFGRQHFDRDIAPQRRVGGAVDLAHSAGANGRRYSVVRQRSSDEIRHLFLLAAASRTFFGEASSSIIPGRQHDPSECATRKISWLTQHNAVKRLEPAIVRARLIRLVRCRSAMPPCVYGWVRACGARRVSVPSERNGVANAECRPRWLRSTGSNTP